MSSTFSENDPRVAPVARQLATMAAHVHAVWARMGISSVDRQRRWDTFLHTSLLPFIDDYGALQTSAEYNAATENDVLLREVCYLATRLDETPRHADVAAIAALLKRHYKRTPMQSPLLAATVGSKQQQQHSKQSMGSESGSADMQIIHDNHTKTTGAEVRRSTQELMYLALPSFADLLKESGNGGESKDIVKRETNSVSRVASSGRVVWIEGVENSAEEDEPNDVPRRDEDGDHEDASNIKYMNQEKQGEEENEEGLPRATQPSSTADAARILAHMMHANTHEEVRQQLQSELDRLKALADNRLRVLQLLCKQRAILNRSASEQVILRAAYRAKYLDDGEDALGSSGASELEKLFHAESTVPTSLLSPTVSAAPATVVKAAPFTEPSVSLPTSSHFLSLPPSPKSSSNSTVASTAAVAVVASSNNLMKSNESLREQPATDYAKVRCVRPTTQAELQLLLSAASSTLDDTTLTWNSVEQQHEQQKEQRVSGTPWPTCSSTTAVSTSQCRSSHAPTAVPATPSSAITPGSRPTILDTDVSSVTAYGTHQDLSLQRIQQEAEAILSAIVEQNRRMQAETQEELQGLETLEVLWRAMTSQKTSPNVPSQEIDKRGVNGVCSLNETHTVALETSISPTKTPADPPVACLQPTPFAETKEQVMARYAYLEEAFATDVATQRAAATSTMTAAAAFAGATVTAAENASSQPSSLGSSVRATESSTSPSTSIHISDSASVTNSSLPLLRATNPRTSGDLDLPPIVRQVLRAPSYAPVFDYVHRTRVTFQKHITNQQDILVEETMKRLRCVYEAYFAATRDKAYAVTLDGELRVAMEEELLESLQTSDEKQCLLCSDDRTNATATAAASTTPSSSSNKVLLNFQRHLMACQQVREQAADEMELLRLRLHIIEQAEPLVVDYQAILREEAEMKLNSRERLLSKKVNMAKQLLQEEKVRRRVVKDLPRIVAHLTELVAAWDALQVADLRNENTEDEAKENPNGAVSPNKVLNAPTACVELYIHNQRVRDLLSRDPPHSGTSALLSSTSTLLTSPAPGGVRRNNVAASRARPRSVSAHATRSSTSYPSPSFRSVSPATPATSRPRTEATSPLPALVHTQPPIQRERQGLQHRRIGSHSPSFSSSTAAAAAKRTAQPSISPPTLPPHASQPTTKLAGSRVRSLSPVVRHGLSARSVNAATGLSKSKSQSPAPRRGVSAAHSAPFSTNFKSHR